MSKIKSCKACGKEVATSAKVCPHCGKKLKIGMFLKIVMGVIIIAVLGAIFGPSDEETRKEFEATLNSISSAEVANISPTGELQAIFSFGSKHTDLQRDNKEKELVGKIVQWTLPVYEVNKDGDGYRIQTSGSGSVVGAFVTVYPRNESQRASIEGLKTNNMITIKGKITGTMMRSIEIEPAVLASN
jgi:hypothetical protein